MLPTSLGFELNFEPSTKSVRIMEAEAKGAILRIELTKERDYEATVWRKLPKQEAETEPRLKRVAGGIYRTEADARDFLTSVIDQSYG
jgi:hypothetical protein